MKKYEKTGKLMKFIRLAGVTQVKIFAMLFICVSIIVSGCGKKDDKATVKSTASEEKSSSDNENAPAEKENDDTSSTKEISEKDDTSNQENLNTEETSAAENETSQAAGGVTETSSEESTEQNSTSASDKKETLSEAEYTPVTLSFTGDIYLSDILYNNYQQSGISGFLGTSLAERFKNVDLMICDHEYAATDQPVENKAQYQIYTYKAPTEREKIWKELGVDIVTLANNHTLDYGEQGLLDTFNALNANGISYVGAGKNLDEAMQAEIREVNGKKIAILGASRFVPNTDWYAGENKAGLMTSYVGTDRFEMLKEEISRLKNEENCDTVIVFVHFGTEKTNQINDNQPVIAHGYVDAGADAVIGCHAHTLQGIEIYNDAPIFYNLGNFLFESYKVDTVVANLTIEYDNSITAGITPCTSASYVTKEAEGDEAVRILQYMESISVNIKVDENGIIHKAE